MDQAREKRKYSTRLSREDRREHVLDAALTVLRDRGLHDLSMEAIAKAADVGKPVLYTAFRTRTELLETLLERELERGMAEVREALPVNLASTEPAAAYTATISTFLQAVIDNPIRWRLILTMPDSAPDDYREALRNARSVMSAKSEELARTGAMLMPEPLATFDSALLGHTMLSFAEMLGRLAARDSDTYPRERLEAFTASLLSLLPGGQALPDGAAGVDDGVQ
jgi:AcrR family transcriptional regulator